MKEIQLANGKGLALVDDEDFARFGKLKWCRINGYASWGSPKVNGKVTKALLHRLIANAPSGKEVDHINRNKLDCQRHNLRVVDHIENQHNHSMHRDNTSGFIGVVWHKRDERWQAQIRLAGKNIFLGYFSDPIAAARARDKAKREMHGAEFGTFNFPQ